MEEKEKERKGYDVKDIGLAESGFKKTLWADRFMPVLALIRERFNREKPLKGVKISCCLHVTSETANLMRTLRAGGAELSLCASNPLSTQDEVAAALVKHFEVKTFAVKGEDNKRYYSHIESVLKENPNITIDDGADLVSTLHTRYKPLIPRILASMEETTTGMVRLRAMERDGSLKVPVIAVNDANTKHFFDNRYGTGQSTVDGIIRATNILFAGKTVVCCGYGWCGRGFATRARGMGATVIVTEVDPLRALEAVMDGFLVMPLEEASPLGDIFCTLTGCKSVIRSEHFSRMKDGAIVCNSGHFNVEIDIPALERMSSKIERGVRPYIDRYELRDGRSIFLLGEGRLINLAAAEGHPPSVMDMSFAIQALCAEYAAKNAGKLKACVYSVPKEIDNEVASLKLKSMGVKIDTLNDEQKRYLSSWEEGT
ncbi:MAG: adenosylhomocysteinase [Planctomycetota bacterium]|nr:adenosylhomocysteinase [Planctomycetota bacterium]